MNMPAAKDPETVKKNVREGYAAIAQGARLLFRRMLLSEHSERRRSRPLRGV